MKRIVSFVFFLLAFVHPSYSVILSTEVIETGIRDSVIVMVNRSGYQVDVINPGRYVVVRNFSGRKVSGKVRILNHRTLLVGHTVVPIRNISRLTVKSSMYPVSRGIFNAGKFFLSTIPKKMFSSLSFSAQGPAALLLILIFVLVVLVSVLLGLLIMFVALPGLMVGKTYNMRQWKMYIKPRR